MKRRFVLLSALAFSLPLRAAEPAMNVVLVHGAYADGSSWSEVIPRLQSAGLRVTAVQNPLSSLADDVAATRRVLARQDGPTVLVGHSWGGNVISEAGVDPKVVALVYVAAHAPDAGEDYARTGARFPVTPVRAGIQKKDGQAWIGEQAFVRDFASGLAPAKARVLYALQGSIAENLFAARSTQAAWRSKPSWYAVSTQDRVIDPGLQRFLAGRMRATTVELAAGHLSLLSHPAEVAELILQAAGRE